MSHVITLRSVYGKMKDCYVQPKRMANGVRLPFVKRVRYNTDGSSEMILSEAELNSPERDYFIPEDYEIRLADGVTFDLDDPFQKNLWECIKDCELIAPSRGSRDSHGDLLIDGNAQRYGLAEFYVDVPGVEAERSVSKKKLISQAWNFIINDSAAGHMTKCKLLGKNMRHAPASDIQDFLMQLAEKDPKQVIDLYTSQDNVMKLLIIDAKESRIITKQSGVWMYGDTALGTTDDAIILFFKIPSNKKILDLLKRETYPDMVLDEDRDIQVKDIDENGNLKPVEEEQVETEMPKPTPPALKSKTTKK